MDDKLGGNVALVSGVHLYTIYEWMLAEIKACGGDGTPTLYVENWKEVMTDAVEYLKANHPDVFQFVDSVTEYDEHNGGNIAMGQEAFVFSSSKKTFRGGDGYDLDLVLVSPTPPRYNSDFVAFPCEWAAELAKPSVRRIVLPGKE